MKMPKNEMNGMTSVKNSNRTELIVSECNTRLFRSVALFIAFDFNIWTAESWEEKKKKKTMAEAEKKLHKQTINTK